MNKKLTISIPILLVIIISVVVTTILINNQEPNKDPNLSPETNQSTDNEEQLMEKAYVKINNEKLEMDLKENSTVSALIKKLPLELTMKDLNGNEKYAYLDEPLPTNTHEPQHIEAGDVMLFGDNCLVVFYKTFDTDYSYSKIGHINNMPELGDGDISITIDAK